MQEITSQNKETLFLFCFQTAQERKKLSQLLYLDDKIHNPHFRASNKVGKE